MKETTKDATAVFLIVFAAACIACGSHYGWHDLVTYSLGFGGGGLGLLTGSKLNPSSLESDENPVLSPANLK